MDEAEEKMWRAFGEWIESHRLSKRLSQKGAARKAGITRQTWIYITGGHSTKRSTVVSMTRAVEADVAEALSMTGFAALPSERSESGVQGLKGRGPSKEADKERLWSMYIDIPPQCQNDVMDLLAVLQRNHSISARQERRDERRAVAEVEQRSTKQPPPPALESNEAPHLAEVEPTPTSVTEMLRQKQKESKRGARMRPVVEYRGNDHTTDKRKSGT